MKPFYSDDWLTLYGGDCRDVLASLPSDSVDCVVTSPPYWGLRDYGTATWEGGDAECDHKGKPLPTAAGFNERYFGRPSSNGNKQDDMRREVFRDTCGKCGATRIDSQLGLERTPEEYVANMVAVFREVRRVLKPSGTCWLNLGDSYYRPQVGNVPQTKNKPAAYPTHSKSGRFVDDGHPFRPDSEGLCWECGCSSDDHAKYRPAGKPKDLVGIPWRVAFALQADGWYLRSDIIWSKPNPMPESVTDRPTKSHEYLFLLTKSARYYFDADAVRESLADSTERIHSSDRVVPTYGGRKTDALGGGHSGLVNGKDRLAKMQAAGGRNIRSVWNIATVPYGNVKIGDAEGGHRDTLSPDCPVHSLRAIRRSLRTDGDDALLDHLRSRSPRNGSGPEPMPADGLFANLDLDSPGPDQSTTDSLPAGSLPSPTPGSAHASRTPTQQTSDGGQGSDAGTESHTSHTPSPTIGQDVGELSGPGAPSATGRSGRGSRTSAASEQPDSVSPEPSRHTPGTDAPLGPDEQRPHTSESSSAGDSARRDPAAQTDTGTSGRCTCPDYNASHFAVFPPELPERCIKAGSSEKGVCPECGAPWERTTERGDPVQQHWAPGTQEKAVAAKGKHGATSVIVTGMVRPKVATGWRPTCDPAACESARSVGFGVDGLEDPRDWGADHSPSVPPVPAVILDPFGGSGTVGMVANRLSRRAILIDLNPEYLKQQMERNAQTPLGLAG